MRLWTLHPRYLDAAGLVALWREALLARAVLRGRTVGYRHHPQLARFRRQACPLACINQYLAAVHDEALRRGYAFDRSKLVRGSVPAHIEETRGQLSHEWDHLLAKLRRRRPEAYRRLSRLTRPEAHPLFRIVPGPVGDWERGSGAA
jgi:hypothetical protein